MAPLLGEWLKPLSNFKHKKPPTWANGLGDLQKLKCNHSAYTATCRTVRKCGCMRPPLTCPKSLRKLYSSLNSLGNTCARHVPDVACAVNEHADMFHLWP